MKNILLSVATLVTMSFAGNGFMQMCDVDGMMINLSSEKQLSEGQNKFNVSMMEGDMKDIKDLRIKFFMPEMPGMPYMESKDICEKTKDAYECDVNFAMNGTWQYMMYVTDKDSVKHKYRNSINLGSSMKMDMQGMHH